MAAPGSDFGRLGWVKFPHDESVARWARAALPAARAAAGDPALARWWVCEGTWFVGVDALPNDPQGRVGAGPVLGGPFADLLGQAGLWPMPLHRAQVSIVRPGYPRPRAGESAAAFRYRQRRDAAHVDGVHAEGSARRRFLREPHAFILGLPLNHAGAEAAPLVVWEGSPAIVRRHLAPLLAGPAGAETDLTEAYHAARREIFQACVRRVLPARPGESCLLHPLALHGVAHWRGAPAQAGERIIAYFRPLHPGGVAGWLSAWAGPA